MEKFYENVRGGRRKKHSGDLLFVMLLALLMWSISVLVRIPSPKPKSRGEPNRYIGPEINPGFLTV